MYSEKNMKYPRFVAISESTGQDQQYDHNFLYDLIVQYGSTFDTTI